MQFLLAALAATVVTTAQLKHDHGRWPRGDVKNKALLWWMAIVGVDVVIALLATAGLVVVPLGDQAGVSELARGALVGVLAPLALRSLVRKAQIKNRTEPVGVTYAYDVVREHCEYALDERITRLRRVDISKLARSATGLGWTRAQ